MTKFLYWPDGNLKPIESLPDRGEWVHPATLDVIPLQKIGLMNTEDRVAIDVFALSENTKDPDKQYSEAWSRNTVDGLAEHTYTETGFKNIDLLKARRIAEVDKIERQVKQGGVTVTLSIGDKDLPTTNDVARQLVFAVSALQSGATPPPSGIPWETMQGEKIKLIEADWSAACQAMALLQFQADNVARNHRDAINALSDPADVYNYDTSANWPANPVL